MRKRLLKIIALISLISLLIVLNGGFKFARSTVRAVGDLNIDWGVAEGVPIFVVDDMAPGQSEARTVTVENNASTIRPVGVRGMKTEESGGLSDKLLITISVDGSDLYGGSTGEKSLSQFFTESFNLEGIELFNLNAGGSKDIIFQVVFNPITGNDYQNTSIIFDLKIGIAVHVPVECQTIIFSGDPIFGTEGKDKLHGTNFNDLIFAFEGNDKIESSNGDDCVVGGGGNDTLNNSNGNDVLFGDNGDDTLNGSNGNDLIFGGNGNDKLYGSNGNDKIFAGDGDDYIQASNGNDYMEGNEGNDHILGSNGVDMIFGGPGDDRLEGGNSIDEIRGGEGNDLLYGGNNDDILQGGEGIDKIYGNSGRDSCIGEVIFSCEI